MLKSPFACCPFVGPAGQLLDRAMRDAGLDRSEIYLTNVVKHFKFVIDGKLRTHRNPGVREIVACRLWLEAELRILQPQILVCLGATVARSNLDTAGKGSVLDIAILLPCGASRRHRPLTPSAPP